MTKTSVRREGDRMVLQLEIPVCRSFAETEQEIQLAVNDAGRLATAEALRAFEADGKPIDRGGVTYTAKGRILKIYESLYGAIPLERLVYQGPGGGATFSPLDERAGIFRSGTPHFARIVAAKYADGGAARVAFDLEQNHGRPCSKTLVESIALDVAALARLEDATTRQDTPPGPERTITRIIVLLDSVAVGGMTDMPPALLAAVQLLDRAGCIQHVAYLARLGEDDRDEAALVRELDRLVKRLRTSHPGADLIGMTNGRPVFSAWLASIEARQVLDPEHLMAELAGVVGTLPRPQDDAPWHGGPQTPAEIRDWLAELAKHLREEPGPTLKATTNELLGWARDSGDATALLAAESAVGRIRAWEQAGLLDYAPDLPDLIFDRPGPLAELATVLLGDRFGRVRRRVGIDRARAILALRERTRTASRWQAFWSAMGGRAGDDVDRGWRSFRDEGRPPSRP